MGLASRAYSSWAPVVRKATERVVARHGGRRTRGVLTCRRTCHSRYIYVVNTAQAVLYHAPNVRVYSLFVAKQNGRTIGPGGNIVLGRPHETRASAHESFHLVREQARAECNHAARVLQKVHGKGAEVHVTADEIAEYGGEVEGPQGGSALAVKRGPSVPGHFQGGK